MGLLAGGGQLQVHAAFVDEGGTEHEEDQQHHQHVDQRDQVDLDVFAAAARPEVQASLLGGRARCDRSVPRRSAPRPSRCAPRCLPPCRASRRTWCRRAVPSANWYRPRRVAATSRSISLISVLMNALSSSLFLPRGRGLHEDLQRPPAESPWRASAHRGDGLARASAGGSSRGTCGVPPWAGEQARDWRAARRWAPRQSGHGHGVLRAYGLAPLAIAARSSQRSLPTSAAQRGQCAAHGCRAARWLYATAASLSSRHSCSARRARGPGVLLCGARGAAPVEPRRRR